MKKLLYIMLCAATTSFAAPDASIQTLMNRHLDKYSKSEHFSGIQVSIKANDQIKNHTSGRISIEPESPELTPGNLFDIGSITKSFTAVLALFAEQDKIINLDHTVNDYLKRYPHWGDISLTGLLNMSTGLPNYSDSPAFNYIVSRDIKKFWRNHELTSLVYPQDFNPPRKPGYFYSNTGYILIDRILSRKYKQAYGRILSDKILVPLGLKNTFYPVPDYNRGSLARLARGYSYNMYDNPELLGQDVTENNLSWAGAAGGIIATSEDVIHWVDALFVNDRLLGKAQKAKMQQLISVKTGEPIKDVSKEDPRGFGLGIIASYNDKIGRFWFYEGQTLGYRALYMHVPCNKVTVVALFNSATNSENDHAGELIDLIYSKILTDNEALQCKKT